MTALPILELGSRWWWWWPIWYDGSRTKLQPNYLLYMERFFRHILMYRQFNPST